MKTLLITLDVTGLPEWHITAVQKQMAAWFENHKAILPTENLIILPAKGETKLYWLEGDPDDVKDVKDMQKIKDRIRPILSVFLNVGLKKPQSKFDDAMGQLDKLRRKKKE